jgi:hypothetical protein
MEGWGPSWFRGLGDDLGALSAVPISISPGRVVAEPLEQRLAGICPGFAGLFELHDPTARVQDVAILVALPSFERTTERVSDRARPAPRWRTTTTAREGRAVGD